MPDSMPLDNAIEILQVSKSPVFQKIFVALKALHAECVEKSKSEKDSADFRSLNHTKGLGVEQSIGVFTAILEESEARLRAATPAERHAMGRDANAFIADLLTPVAEVKEPIICGPSSLDETPQPDGESKTDGFVSADGQKVYTLPGMRVVAAEFVPKR